MKQILFFLILISLHSFAQNDSINLLDEVKLKGNFSKKLNAGYQITIINDSIIDNSVQSLGDLLQQQANIYFKQHGNGMVSSISLRGTGASATGVYWNGIAINSSLNGQTDFNTLSPNGFNEIEIKKGAGTNLLGSGAIGGAINLKDIVRFIPDKEIKANIGYGSYNTQELFVQGKLSTKKIVGKISVNGIKSDNDYPFLETNLYNENAFYKNHHLNGVFGYKLNNNNELKLFTNYSNNYRELARSLTAPSNNLYKNEDARLLLNWQNFGNKYNSNFNFAYLGEDYQFFLDKNFNDYSFGKTKNYIAKYNFKYLLKKQQSLLIGLENKFTKGNGSDIQKKERNVFEIYSLYHQKLWNKLSYNLSVRKGFSNIYTIPIIYAVDTRFDLSSKLNLRANYSTNYKLPTFNDLYWEYSGNENLKPEKNQSYEFGFYVNTKKFSSNLTVFQIDSQDLIQWKPVSATFWIPANVQQVTNTGIEFNLSYHFNIAQHQFRFQTQYSYTNAVDKKLDKQLIYVPFHKGNLNFTYHIKGWQFNYNFQYNGMAYTTTSNTQFVADFALHNIQFHKKILKNKLAIGLYINNLFNKNYQVVAFRPMLNRNFKLNINIKI